MRKPGGAVAAEKAALRGILLARRDSVSHDMARIAGRRILGAVAGSPEFCGAGTVACYYPVGSEVPTQDIIGEAASRGKRVCLPRMAGGALEFRTVDGPGALERAGSGPFGTTEPREGCPACGPGEMDLVIVPAVGVSMDGTRLGHGGGHYDRFLAGLGGRGGGGPPVMALAFARQVVGSMPAAPHDVPVDVVVTERGLFRTRR